MERECNNGHLVTEDYLKACPRCGRPLASGSGKYPSLAPHRVKVDAPKLVPFLVGAVIVALFGTLLTSAAEHGPAEDFGWLLLAVAVVLAIVAVQDHLRRR